MTTPYFESKGIDAPRLCAELLLSHVLGCSRIDLYTGFENPVADDRLSAFRELVRRRSAREPIQHLTGRTEFWSLPIHCDARALVPRPETELVVQAVLDYVNGRDDPAIADIGTGTGCIAAALARELPNASLVASDASAEALELAAENFTALDVADRVRLIEGDLAAPFVNEGLTGCFDVVASNPPYIPDDEWASLQPEVRDHDPAQALRGGPDGLRIMDRLLRDTGPLLKPDGAMIMEIGVNQAERVQEMLGSTGWCASEILPDGAGIQRVLIAKPA